MQHPLEKRELKNEVIKIPRRVIQEMILHRHYRAFMIFLQLKPLYISGVIMNDGGKLPYQSIAKYLGLSLSGTRGKIQQLKKHKLIRVDREKNFHLASYKTFVNIFKPQFLRRMRKYNYRNVAPADQLIKMSAIRENYRKQEHVLKHKIINKEIYGTVNAHVDRIKQPEGLQNSSFPSTNDCRTGAKQTESSVFPHQLKTIAGSKHAHTEFRTNTGRLNKCGRMKKKMLLQDYDNLLHKHKRIYLEKLEHIQNGYPDINPFITLSCAGIGRLFGTGASAGYYQRQHLANANLITIKDGGHLHIYPVAIDTREELRKEGGNVFHYNYPVKRGNRGREDKFFLHLPDNLDVNLNFIYQNAKN